MASENTSMLYIEIFAEFVEFKTVKFHVVLRLLRYVLAMQESGARFTKNLTMCHMIVVKSSQICRKSIINHQVTTSHDNVMIVVS